MKIDYEKKKFYARYGKITISYRDVAVNFGKGPKQSRLTKSFKYIKPYVWKEIHQRICNMMQNLIKKMIDKNRNKIKKELF